MTKEQATNDLIKMIDQLPLIRKDYEHLLMCVKILSENQKNDKNK